MCEGYKVSIGKDNRFFSLEESEFAPGTKVSFRVPFVSDADVSVTSADVQLRQERGFDDSDYHFCFIMPAQEVRINVSVRNTMMHRVRPADGANRGMGGSPMSFMAGGSPVSSMGGNPSGSMAGGMNAGMMGMQPPPMNSGTDPNSDISRSINAAPWSEAGRDTAESERPGARICPSCGATITVPTVRFCTECGAILGK